MMTVIFALSPRYNTFIATDMQQIKYDSLFYLEIMAHSNEMYNVKFSFI